MHQKKKYVYIKRLNAKEVLITRRDEEIVFPFAGGPAKLSGRNYEFQEPTLGRESTVRRDNLSGESQGDREEFQTETKDDAEAREDFWSIQGDFIYRHHIEPRVQLYVPQEESFPIPLKYIVVIRSTHTDLYIAEENELTTTSLNETPSRRKMWSGWRLTPIQTTSLPDKNWKSRSKKRETSIGNRETKTRTCQKVKLREFIRLIRVTKNT